MAEYGEWNRKGAVLSDVTAGKEYGVTRDFIAKGIQDGELEYREGSVWGAPYLRILRSQLEPYIAASGPASLSFARQQAGAEYTLFAAKPDCIGEATGQRAAVPAKVTPRGPIGAGTL